MMNATFDQRLVRLARKHRRMAMGIIYRMRPDGLIVAHPRRGAAPRFPWRALLTMAALAFAFKAFLLASLGEETYALRLAILEGGNPAEQAAAWLMQPDRATAGLAVVMDALAS